jgi:hypothetical protein
MKQPPEQGGDDMNDIPTAQLDNDDIDIIREALLIGLASFGEIHKLDADQQRVRDSSRSVPDSIRVMMTGEVGSAGIFASALMVLEHARKRAEKCSVA